MMLNIMPYHCQYCVQGFKGMVHVSDEARLQGLNLIELQSDDAVKGPVWDTLEANDPIFVNGFGHGNVDIYTGDTTEAIFTDLECSILSGRVVHLLSCLTAVQLGPAVITAGGITYIGYLISWTWLADDITADPYDDWYAECYYRSANEFPIALIQGDMASEAYTRSIAEYNRWIEIWETERSGDPLAADAISWLLFDRDGLTVLGDQSATIESLEVTTNPATAITPKEAVLNSKLDDDGGEPCDCGFEWGETEAYGNTTPTQSRTKGQTFSQLIEALSPATPYHFRAFATNTEETSYGADRTFTTLIELPKIRVGSPTSWEWKDCPVASVDFWSDAVGVIDLPAVAADIDLPNVIVAGLPSITLIRVVAVLKVRSLEKTNPGSNAINGAQAIRVKKSTGTWGVDDVVAIDLADNMWTLAASAREPGDVLIGDNDLKSKVDGNGTYNLRFKDALVDYDNLRLNDVLVGLRFYYTS